MPANCTIIKESSDLVSLSWALPLTNCAVYTYNVSWLWEAKWNGSLADEDWDTTGQTSYTISGIRPYSEVLISIKGKTASGYGPALECEALTAEYFPSAPSIVSVTEGSNYLSVTWEPPEEPNGVIQRYRITRIGDDGEEEMQETDGDTLTARVYGTAACHNYTLTVAAKTAKGSLETVTCDGTASRNFTVMWDHGSVTCKDQYYSITWNSTVKWSADEDQGETEVPGNETAYTFLDATPTLSTSCVAIMKDAEGGVCCDHTTAEDGPSAPVIKEISSFRGDVRISWSPPEEANGVEFDDVTEGLVVGLEKCHTYTFSVAAGTIVWGNKSETREVEVVNYVDSVTCISGGTDRVLAQ
ncbi:tyrosine phosphatase LAR [Penaeus vannamei]|uniref:Tyrosine phosphatase LAR n=1 Tax=Penaeus vannamei TaxID=6689 RepID=A0A3R7PU79_PENVA|nr:tyrosine phosphatase LAR [Penaeus vannamei]